MQWLVVFLFLAGRVSGQSTNTRSLKTKAEIIAEEELLTQAHAAACASQFSCWNCTAVPACHWCAGDGKCHAFASPYGCAIGLDCYDAGECVRVTPEFRGLDTSASYAFPFVIYVVIGVCSVLLISNVILIDCLLMTPERPLTPQSFAEVRQEEEQEEEEQADSDVNSVLLTSIQEELSSPLHENAPVRGNRRSRRPCFSKRRKVCCASLSAFAVLATLVGIIVLGPRMVSYSVCNTRIEWSSVFRSLAHGRVSADVELHLSLSNPNIVGLDVQHFSCQIKYQNRIVAQGWLTTALTGSQVTSALTEAKVTSALAESKVLSHTKQANQTKESLSPLGRLAARSVSDVVGTVRFAPGLRMALKMWAAHQRKELLLDISLDLGGDITLFDKTLYHVNTTFAVADVDVNVPTDRHLCRCS